MCLTGQPIVYPRNDLSYAENFLHMMFAVPSEKYQVGDLSTTSATAMAKGLANCWMKIAHKRSAAARPQ